MCLSVCLSVTNYCENTVRARKLKIGIEVDMGMVEVKIIVSKFVDQREPLQEPKRAEMSQKIKLFKICRMGARWQGMVHERSSGQFKKIGLDHALKSKNIYFLKIVT